MHVLLLYLESLLFEDLASLLMLFMSKLFLVVCHFVGHQLPPGPSDSQMILLEASEPFLEDGVHQYLALVPNVCIVNSRKALSHEGSLTNSGDVVQESPLVDRHRPPSIEYCSLLGFELQLLVFVDHDPYRLINS